MKAIRAAFDMGGLANAASKPARFGRVEMVRQTSATECALACLTMIANFHGLKLDLNRARRLFPPSIRGTSLRTLLSSFRQLGFGARAVRVDIDELVLLSLPAVLHWDFNHFVVLWKMRRGRALIFDPRGGSSWISSREIGNHFTGVCVEINSFEQKHVPYPKHGASFRVRDYLGRRDLKDAALVVFFSACIQTVAFATPIFLQRLVDQRLGGTSAVNLLSSLLLLLTGVGGLCIWVRQVILTRVGLRFSRQISAKTVAHLLRLPISWFEARHIADVVARLQSIIPIRASFIEGRLAAILDGALSFALLIAMLFYIPPLTVLALGAVAFYALCRLLMIPRLRALQLAQFSAATSEQAKLIEGIRMIRTIRISGLEWGMLASWENKYSHLSNNFESAARLTAFQQSGSAAVTGIEAVCSLWIGVYLLEQHAITLGVLVAYSALKAIFIVRCLGIVDAFVNSRLASVHLDRLDDILREPIDPHVLPSLAPARAYRGALRLVDIYHSYGPDEPMVLNGISLTVESGSHIAIAGRSGSGKSTLAQIVVGINVPNRGMVLYDDSTVEEFGTEQLRRQVSGVLQGEPLFSGTIAENIALLDEAAELEAVVAAAKLARIDAFIESLPLAYDTHIGEDGVAISGGQKQRVLLARALYRKPRLLVIDEGTSSLDPETEAAVTSAIASLSITRISFTHRIETLLSADRAYALTKGTLEPLSLSQYVSDLTVAASSSCT